MRGSEFLELALWAAYGMYAEYGGAPAAGTVAGIGRVQGKLCMVIANDATVKAGAFFPMTCKKVLRAQAIALENHIPTLYLVDSAGAFLPLQEEVFPDQDDFGRVFRNNAVMSARGIPQMTAIMGMCVAGGAYLPVMTDTILMTEGSGLFLAGPALVQAAIGQKTPAEELGGAAMHAEISGTVDFKEANDHLCMARMRSLVGRLGQRPNPGSGAPFSVLPYDSVRDAPKYAAEELYGFLDPAPGASNVYDMREIIARLVDRSEFDEYKADFGRTLVCGYARIGGRAVGIVANQKLNQRQTVAMGPQAGTQRIEVGGVIYTESAQKAARFILDCNQSLVPLLFLHDVNGFMVGKDAEWSGIIRAGAKMVSAVSTSVVPKDFGDRWRQLWRGALRDVRQGLRSALSVRVADGSRPGSAGPRSTRRRRRVTSRTRARRARLAEHLRGDQAGKPGSDNPDPHMSSSRFAGHSVASEGDFRHTGVSVSGTSFSGRRAAGGGRAGGRRGGHPHRGPGPVGPHGAGRPGHRQGGDDIAERPEDRGGDAGDPDVALFPFYRPAAVGYRGQLAAQRDRGGDGPRRPPGQPGRDHRVDRLAAGVGQDGAAQGRAVRRTVPPT